jgi:hypothetical protein
MEVDESVQDPEVLFCEQTQKSQITAEIISAD